MDNLDGFMEVDDLQPYRDVTLDEVEDIRLYLEKNPTIKKRFVSEDDEYFMMMVQPYTSDGLNYFRDKVVSIADPILSNYDIYYGGQAYVTGTMPAMIRDDVIILARIGILIMVTILLINLRSIAAVGMVIMVIGLSLFAMIGSMGWIYYLTGSDRFLFTLANTSMPIILLTIANSDGVHVVSKFFKELRIKKDTKSAVASTMDSLLIPIFLTSITTIAAFGTLTLSPLEPLFGYGIIIGIGIAWAWLLSSFLLPSVITLKSWNLKSNAISKPSFFEKIINKLGKVVFTHPKYIFSIGAFFVLIGLTGLSKVIVDVNMRTVMDDDPDFEVVPDDRKKVNNLFTMYSMSGDPDDFSTLIDYEYEVGLITAFSKVMTTKEIFAYVNEMNNQVKAIMNPNLSVDFTGMIVILRDLVIMVVRSSALSIIFSLIIIGIIASIFFKRILWGILAVVPLSSAVIINFGFMGYFGIELSHITALLSSVIIGVGVDFAIHYISQYRRLSRTSDIKKLSRNVVDDVGYPIILDAASNMGFGALLFSAFVPIQYIGGLMVFAMVSTSLGTLTVLAASTELMKNRLVNKG